MSDHGVRVVCFDLGGVLVRICRSWEEACERAGVAVRGREVFHRPELRQRRGEALDLYQTGRMTCRAYFEAVAGTTEGHYSPEEIERIHLAWTLDDYAGVADLIGALNATPGIVTACLSNTNHGHWMTMLGSRENGAEGRSASEAVCRLAQRYASHLIRVGKPEGGAYEAVERGLGAARAEIVFFDDLAENTAAAEQRGWHAVTIDHASDTASQIEGALRRLGVLR